MDTEGRAIWQELSLMHKGKRNAIPAARLGAMVRFGGSGGGVGVREAITRNLPDFPGFVAACSNGFFVAETAEEIRDYLEGLDGRCAGLDHRRQTLSAKARDLGYVESEGTWHRETTPEPAAPGRLFPVLADGRND